jgi:hypothetical protein
VPAAGRDRSPLAAGSRHCPPGCRKGIDSRSHRWLLEHTPGRRIRRVFCTPEARLLDLKDGHNLTSFAQLARSGAGLVSVEDAEGFLRASFAAAAVEVVQGLLGGRSGETPVAASGPARH